MAAGIRSAGWGSWFIFSIEPIYQRFVCKKWYCSNHPNDWASHLYIKRKSIDLCTWAFRSCLYYRNTCYTVENLLKVPKLWANMFSLIQIFSYIGWCLWACFNKEVWTLCFLFLNTQHYHKLLSHKKVRAPVFYFMQFGKKGDPCLEVS